MDRTKDFDTSVLNHFKAKGVPEEKLNNLRKAHILRSLATKSEFGRAAQDVLHSLDTLAANVREHRRDYVQQGRLSEAERDRIEEEVGMYVKLCSSNIQKLEKTVEDEQQMASPSTNSSMVAFRLGVVLALSEKLQQITTLFDHCRGLRYQQTLQKQQSTKPKPQLSTIFQQASAAAVEAAVRSNGTVTSAPHDNQQVMQMVQQENQALQQDLLSMSDQARHVERSMREVATLNQMFSTQVLHQSEQIEHIYMQAVKSTVNIQTGNTHLQKAIKLNSSARLYVLVLLLIASLGLLFLDWYSS